MAKADFCFTYYDGDAARDMAHMNRLERGAYTDIIISQRKFGHLSEDQIKKILGRDFAECWGAIELILKKDTAGLFFIEWLETSESKAKKHSKHQSEKRKGKTGKNQTETETEPKLTEQQPLGDGNGYEDGSEDEIVKEWQEWGNLILTDSDHIWQGMRGRKITRDELNNFFSVAVRNQWTMDTQQSFRITLHGFKPITNDRRSDQKAPNGAITRFAGTNYDKPL